MPTRFRVSVTLLLCIGFAGALFASRAHASDTEPLSRAADLEPIGSEYFEHREESKPGENFAFSNAQFWLPWPHSAVRGILCVVLHPRGDVGAALESPRQWIAFARRNDFALLAISFSPARPEIRHWCRASEGSGRALLATIDDVSKQAEAPRLASLPVIVAGICAAGQYAFEFAAFAPDRTAAFFTMGGSQHDISEVSNAASSSGLLVGATDRGPKAVTNLFGLFGRGRELAAPWMFALERTSDYDRGLVSANTIRYLEHAMQACSPGHGSDFRPGQIQQAAVPLQTLISPPILQSAFGEGAPAILHYPTCVLPAGTSPDDWISGRSLPLSSDLSFVAATLPRHGTVTPSAVDLGTLSKEDPAAKLEAIYHVSCEASAEAPEAVQVGDLGQGVESTLMKVGVRSWQLTCRISAASLPSGGFRYDLPIRFMRSGRALLGGTFVRLTGRVVGDLRVTPSSVDVNRVLETSTQCTIRVRSAKGLDVRLLDVQSSAPQFAHAKLFTADTQGEILCSFTPPSPDSPSVSGYFLIRAGTSAEDRIKIPFLWLSPRPDDSNEQQ